MALPPLHLFILKQFWGLGKENFESKIIKNRPLCHYRHINSYTIVGLYTLFAIATSENVYSSLSPRLENSSCCGSPATPVPPPQPQSSGHPLPPRCGRAVGNGRAKAAWDPDVQLCPTLRPHGLQPSGLLCPWNLPARTLEWVAISCSRGSS